MTPMSPFATKTKHLRRIRGAWPAENSQPEVFGSEQARRVTPTGKTQSNPYVGVSGQERQERHGEKVKRAHQRPSRQAPPTP